MTQQSDPSYDDLDEPGWACRGISFAAVMLILLGVFQTIAGLTAPSTTSSSSSPRTTSSTSIQRCGLDPPRHRHRHGRRRRSACPSARARGAAVFLAMLSAIRTSSSSHYPFWSLLLIGLVWVLFSLTRLALDEE